VHGVEVKETAPARLINALKTGARRGLDIAVSQVVVVETIEVANEIGAKVVGHVVGRLSLNRSDKGGIIRNASVDVSEGGLADIGAKSRAARLSHNRSAVAKVASFASGRIISTLNTASVIVVILHVLSISRAKRILGLVHASISSALEDKVGMSGYWKFSVT
jgi:hypothetical protein